MVRAYVPLVKHVTFVSAVRSLTSRYHQHCCYECKGVYTDSCGTPTENKHCVGCQSAHGRPLWDRDRDPMKCCLELGACEMVTDGATIALFKLAGPGPWFICKTCHRTHGYLPKEN